ncbi:MAG: AbrB/MazE/SpoVT family DNA-binding domain-containing protein [Candidatus Paceibacterota bacterium]|jgi:AbrB family looped-hinge helix DNA binding protein
MEITQTKQALFSLVKVKSKGQVTIPARMREELHLSDGDFLEAVVKNNGVFFIPKTLVNREIDGIFEQGMSDYRKGKGSGAFSSVKEFKASRKKLKTV